MILPFNGKSPSLGKNVFIAPSAVVIGDVHLADDVSVWFGAVIRGDLDRISIGAGTNVQDNCTLHVDKGNPLHIGRQVTIGHNAVVHGCTVEDHVLIGIGAVLLNDAHIGAGGLVAAGAVVSQGMQVGPMTLVAGIPAVIKKSYDAAIIDQHKSDAGIYMALAREYALLGDL
ncbi:MAG: gamma carbonic anhydrase family protein [Desulfatitalea sp.]|nr:gamma carbonic anhydrase family protein [Desulfatitalea sp.]NNK01494.1 gamma carbonic anhydrase family protein [Desulfatitalea sp.]